MDFKLSLADLKNHLQVFFESQNKMLPIISIQKTAQDIILVSATAGKPLTLGYLKESLASLPDDHLKISVSCGSQKALVFGYRLTQTQILFS
ncbi:hypothetical protein FC19_GL000895 [Liquorilactobacillus aquaticus DSM 21051]|uniref:Uncharacterized protein n=2 Tax=Liquorilactobacillus aquaticus TaxID=392566 RepID=A0A0R2D7U4_9LACO|nr:hypothetical protein FC19_GL000895 [Liquorilactobacillus aquaticus DSM 21051]